MTGHPLPFVTIAIPVLNEARYIRACIESLLVQAPFDTFEILILDGGSTDGTVDIAAAMAADHACIRVVHNPKRLQSAAINLAARVAAPESTVILRADAHSVYPLNYLRDCVTALTSTGATSVVVPMRTVGQRGFQKAVAAAQNSRLGNGGSPHRVGGCSRFVDHGHHAAFDRQFFMAVGGYNDAFTPNEDAEHDCRAIQAGGRIWMCVEATVTYFPRRDPLSLARQYFRHGGARARTLLAHRIRPKLRQLASLIILTGCAAGLALAPANPVTALFPVLYAASCLTWGSVAAIRDRDPWLLAMGPAAMIMHLSWGAGFLRTCLIHAVTAGRIGLARRVTPPAVTSD
ncbi:MAG: glycosyltransferase family 2 protein [Acetobacteraceae bacterium]|nr:glycosyltransferase family 2 protein [Acetobacteraceae bacterium]MBV8524000.1 glycosyltransferase family 2 protein [Acetobacteraceae bacterium]MBV8589839.1 glycosyltransferase family 2 protein [Acetobacteraceae bacterium]